MPEINKDSNKNYTEIPDISTGKLLILSVVSANVYVFLSFFIIRNWHEKGLIYIFESDVAIWNQVGIGAGSGILATAIVYLVIRFTPVNQILSDFSIFEALSKAKFSFFDNLQISIFAGAGEELLFRGAIQPLLGNTLTSIIFIGIHGYFKFRTPAHLFFGAMMFGLSFMLGFLADAVGLIAAMTAHAIYDVIMLQMLQRNNSKN